MFYIFVDDDTGALLVRSGLVSAGVIEQVRRAAEALGGTIGERLVESGMVSDDALTDLYLNYLQVPRVSASTLARLPVAAIAALPHKMAIALRAIPISRDANNNLLVAMSDPLQGRAVGDISAYTGARVIRTVATQMQIAWCLAHYYDYLTPLGKRLLQPDSNATSQHRATTAASSTIARSRTASGEIRISKTISTIAPEPPTTAIPGGIGGSKSREVMTSAIRASERSDLIVEAPGRRTEEDTAKIVTRHRQRPPAVQPPELEARSGEVELKPGPQPKVTTGPTIVIDNLGLPTAADSQPSIPIEVDVTAGNTPPAHDSASMPTREQLTGASGRTVRKTYIGVPTGPSAEPHPEDSHLQAASTRGDPQAYDFDDATDPSWGPPGTTIPPPLRGKPLPLGNAHSDAIPISHPDTPALPLARPSLTERSRPHATAESDLTRNLEDATRSVLDLIHVLESTTDRDAVVAAMISHIAEAHVRAGLFVTRGNELALFSMVPAATTMSAVTLRLDRSSTLQEVVEARLPYRGPMHDPDSRTFLEAVLGACPSEILLVPIAVRDRVVGVLFGEHRTRHTFDDQLALVARAAGIALERILMAKRG